MLGYLFTDGCLELGDRLHLGRPCIGTPAATKKEKDKEKDMLHARARPLAPWVEDAAKATVSEETTRLKPFTRAAWISRSWLSRSRCDAMVPSSSASGSAWSSGSRPSGSQACVPQVGRPPPKGGGGGGRGTLGDLPPLYSQAWSPLLQTVRFFVGKKRHWALLS